MSDQAVIEQDLRNLIARKEAVLVVGTGVSVSASGGQAAASWKGLLLSGVDWCATLQPQLRRSGWRKRQKAAIEKGNTREMIAAADQIADQLHEFAPGEFAKWLEDRVGSLRIKDRAVLDALIALDLPFTTTNYDHLIEEATKLAAVSWRETTKVERVLRGRESGVIHFHGEWDQPDSVVLGIKSYEAVKNDEHAQAVLKSLRTDKSLLLVGCADGLGDPNFGAFLTWTRSAFASSPFRQYCLVRECEREKLQAQHPLTERTVFLSYGKEFTDLAPFLRTLAPAKSSSSPSKKSPAKARLPKTSPLSPTIAAYQRHLAEETRLLRMIGLSDNLQIDLEIEHAYVPLRAVVTRSLTGKHPGRYSRKELAEGGHTEETQLAEMFAVANRFKKRGVVLLGEPGAGKTTGARQLCWLLASGKRTPPDLGLPRGLVPVFLRLRNLREADANRSFRDLVLEEARNSDAPDAHADPGPELWNRSQPTLWVFDGLDEVVSEPVRVRVSQRLQEFLGHRAVDRVLVTSRYQGYGPAVDLGAGFVQFHVQPLDQGQVEKFVDRWFHAAYHQLYGATTKATKEAKADAANLKRILNQQEFTIGGLRELRTNPLLLTVVCLVYHQEHSLPQGRAALYDKCVTVLLESWRKGLYEARKAQRFDPRAAQRALARLAWWMHCQSEDQSDAKTEREEDRRGSPSAPIKDMAKAVAGTLAETAPGAGLGRDGRTFIERMRDESGILVTARPECCSFLHLTFQEYLAATHAVEEGLARELVARSGKSWWRETVLLALARATTPFARQFFNAFIESRAWERDLDLTGRCLDETAVTVLDPFLWKLNDPQVPVAQKLSVLHLLRQKDDPRLVAACGKLAKNDNTELASAAIEILARSKPAARAEVVGKPAVEIAAALKPGEIQLDRRSGIAFAAIPAGEFDMGSDEWDWAKPIHRVRITKPFLLGKYPVTNAEYERFLTESGRTTLPTYWNDKNFNQPQQPVVGVSWHDAQAFCKWAGCRLPTEAEWEYACRAGSTGAYCFGDDEAKLKEYAWFYGNSRSRTHPVGQKKPNAWGLYDVHGNVWEWCQDWYAADYYRRSPKDDPTGPAKAASRVLRGGSWGSGPAVLRCACRVSITPDGRDDGVGFRCVWVGASSP